MDISSHDPLKNLQKSSKYNVNTIEINTFIDTIIIYHYLRSGIARLTTIFFLWIFRLLCVSEWILRWFSSNSTKNVFRILMVIALILKVVSNIWHFTLSVLSICEYMGPFDFLVSSSIYSFSVFNPSLCRSFTYLVSFTPRYFIYHFFIFFIQYFLILVFPPSTPPFSHHHLPSPTTSLLFQPPSEKGWPLKGIKQTWHSKLQ